MTDYSGSVAAILVVVMDGAVLMLDERLLAVAILVVLMDGAVLMLDECLFWVGRRNSGASNGDVLNPDE